MEHTRVIDIAVLLQLKKQGTVLTIDDETMHEAQTGHWRVKPVAVDGGVRVELEKNRDARAKDGR